MEFISITNDPQVAQYFDRCGIHDIMVDLEIIGKNERQQGLNTFITAHTIEDVSLIKASLSNSKCLVRINPVYEGTKGEIDEVICRGADIIMLPMFKTVDEVKFFIDCVGNRAKIYLLLETAQAMVRVDDITQINGIDAIHIGLNDLSISLGLRFLYEPVIGGLIEYLAKKIIAKNIKFGFGGVSRLEMGKLLLSEHHRLGSQMVILNRHFKYYKETYDEIVKAVDVKNEIDKINNYLKNLDQCSIVELEQNRLDFVQEIKNQMKS
jgi:2-keto-3-deoxy-L-rhamnonate aldolase RhmA